jgi:hypothetical protein
MATTKKTVKKDDATDKKKSTTAKKKTTTKKKTNVKKEVESTGVVDEFLNENIGKVVTETEAPKPEKKTTTKKTDENKLIDAEAELNEILSQQITEENIRVADEIEKTISEQKDFKKKWEKLELVEDSQEPPQNIASKCEIGDVSGEIEVVNPTDDDVKAPEEKWKELGLTNELQADIQKTVSELYNTDTTIEVVDENDKPKDVVYPPIVDNIEPQEKQKTPTVYDLRVNLEKKEEAPKFTFVNTSMGVRFD